MLEIAVADVGVAQDAAKALEEQVGLLGLVQLGRLADAISRRRAFALQVQERIAGLRAIRPGQEVADTEGVYWFMRFGVDAGLLSVTKDEFARAVAAEGIPVMPSYRHIPSEAKWFRERRVFPPSDYPWGLPAYKGDRDATFPCPQAVAHLTDEDMALIATALESGAKKSPRQRTIDLATILRQF